MCEIEFDACGTNCAAAFKNRTGCILKTLVVIVLAAVAFVWLVVPRIERRMMYANDSSRVDPAGLGIGRVAEEVVGLPDGTNLVTWYAAAQPGQPTLLYFHGNGGNLLNRAERVQLFSSRGFGILLMSYRGSSGSDGAPSERNNVADAKTMYDRLVAKGVAARDVFLYGESLGSGVAVQVAAEKPVGGVILDAPYTSIVDVAAIFYPYLPVRYVMSDRYETTSYASAVTAPALVVHGERDGIIPVAMGREVAAKLGGPTQFQSFPEAGHTDHFQHGSFDVIADWIAATHGTPAIENRLE